MHSFEAAVSKSSLTCRRRVGSMMLGALVAAAIAAPAFAQANPQAQQARPHAANNQFDVNAKRIKPAPGVGAPQFSPPAPVRVQAPPRHESPAPSHDRGRYQAPTGHHAPARHREPSRYQAPVHVERPHRAAYQHRAAYEFRHSDRAYLQRHYRSSLRTVRVDRRPVFVTGRAIPVAYRSQVAMFPAHLHRHVPPPPRGYRMGYYQGYSVVYDPVTFAVLSVLDLLID